MEDVILLLPTEAFPTGVSQTGNTISRGAELSCSRGRVDAPASGRVRPLVLAPAIPCGRHKVRQGERQLHILFIVKHFRRPAALLALLAVLFAQLATAAYACPLIQQVLNAPVIAQGEAATPCAEMDMAVAEGMSALCLEHCKAGQQLVDNHSPVPALDVAADLAFVVHASIADVTRPLRVPDPPAFRATAPPVFASSSRLRI